MLTYNAETKEYWFEAETGTERETQEIMKVLAPGTKHIRNEFITLQTAYYIFA